MLKKGYTPKYPHQDSQLVRMNVHKNSWLMLHVHPTTCFKALRFARSQIIFEKTILIQSIKKLPPIQGVKHDVHIV